MATSAMTQTVGIMSASSSNSITSRHSLSARQCTPARASFPGWPLHLLLGLPVLGLGSRPSRQVGVVCAATEEKEKEMEIEKEKAVDSEPDAVVVTQKFGLEAGLWKIFTSKDNGEGATKGKKTVQAKELLARYGGAYLATSISLSIVSFTICYILVQSGVDVPRVLEKVGIHVNETGEKVGTFALAYAAHKAASPIRFPPTVALTPIVAGWFGKKPADDKSKSE